jgi:GxxExxY protein
MDWPSSEEIESITERVIGCAIAVHTALGPGLLESIYHDCLAIEFRTQNIPFQRDHRVHLTYRGEGVRDDLKVDLLVERTVIVEVKAVERLHPVHQAQVITYLKLTGCPAGLLMNFNSPSLRAGLKRLDHPELYVVRRAARRELLSKEREDRESSAPHHPNAKFEIS